MATSRPNGAGSAPPSRFLDWIHANGRLRRREPLALEVVVVSPNHKEGVPEPKTVADLVDHYFRERFSRRDVAFTSATTRNHRSALLLFAAGIGDRDPSTLTRGDV